MKIRFSCIVGHNPSMIGLPKSSKYNFSDRQNNRTVGGCRDYPIKLDPMECSKQPE